MTRRQHPAERARERVADTIVTTEWWEAERAAAKRDRAVERLCHTLAWCVVILTATVMVVIVADTIGGR